MICHELRLLCVLYCFQLLKPKLLAPTLLKCALPKYMSADPCMLNRAQLAAYLAVSSSRSRMSWYSSNLRNVSRNRVFSRRAAAISLVPPSIRQLMHSSSSQRPTPSQHIPSSRPCRLEQSAFSFKSRGSTDDTYRNGVVHLTCKLRCNSATASLSLFCSPSTSVLDAAIVPLRSFSRL